MWRKEYRDERPHNLGRCWWMFKQAQADCGSAPAGCAEEFRLTYIYIIVKNLLYAYCVPRGRGRRNVWKPCNQPWDPIRKCLADGKHRWSCCVYIFRNKGWYPEIHDIKEPPECFARMDNEVVKRITCTSFSLMVRIKSIIVFQKKKREEQVHWQHSAGSMEALADISTALGTRLRYKLLLRSCLPARSPTAEPCQPLRCLQQKTKHRASQPVRDCRCLQDTPAQRLEWWEMRIGSNQGQLYYYEISKRKIDTD